MNWLLVTAINSEGTIRHGVNDPGANNCGDDFIRLGVEKLVREVDSEAQIHLIDKDDEKNYSNPIPFDRCIWCGMPVFWSHEKTQNHTHIWWRKLMMNWVSKDPKKFMVLGAGVFIGGTAHNLNDMYWSWEQLKKRIWGLTFREPFMAELNYPCLPCPAIFSIGDYRRDNIFKLCNLMEYGSHYKFMNPAEYRVWAENLQEIADILLENRFRFISHNTKETALAERSGWDVKDVYRPNFEKPEELLKVYGRCGKFFGNRMHGGVVSRGNNADVWNVGYCTRLGMVSKVGGRTCQPSQLKLDELQEWASTTNEVPEFYFDEEFEKQVNIVRNFMNQDDE